MKLISFLSDFGLRDNFVGVVKAVILKINPSAQIVDICHQISPHSIWEAGFLLKSSFRFFPKGTIHLAVVDPEVGTPRKAIIVKTENFYFIAPDNGLLSFVLEEEPPLKIIEITNERYFLKPVSSTFHARDIFAPVAGYLSKGRAIDKFGNEVSDYNKLEWVLPKIRKNVLEGEVIYIDYFGNLVTNIRKEVFENFVRNRRFRIKAGDFYIKKISFNYAQADSKQPIALIDSFGYLEISLKEKNAAYSLRLNKGSKIKVLVR